MTNTSNSHAATYRPRRLGDVLGQERTVTSLRNFLVGKTTRFGQQLKLPPVLLFAGTSGCGKCLGKGTPVLMFDGTVKKVETIQPGDQLMGPDSTPRNVLSTCRGVENLYRVVPTKGDPYVVNESHILSLKKSTNGLSLPGPKGTIVDISVKQLLEFPKYWNTVLKGYRVGVSFEETPVPVDPYILGVWLGDGSTGTARVTTADPEIKQALEEFCVANQVEGKPSSRQLQLVEVQTKSAATTYALTTGRTGGLPSQNPLVVGLRELGIYKSKRIPQCYKANSEKVRLELLAGLLDTDGYLNQGCFYLATRSKDLAGDVAFVARSLGFAAYVSHKMAHVLYKGVDTYCSTYIVGISGHVDRIPTRIPYKQAGPRRQTKDVLVVGITLEPLGPGEYFGFEIDGDRRFLLGDFTVTHNTTLARIVAAAITCKDFDFATGDPCGVCADCVVALDEGVTSGPNFMHIDGSGKDLKDTVTTKLREFVHKAPWGKARANVCVTDEAQALTYQSREALLTLCENMPASSYIIFTTTDPEAIPVAIRTRCTPYFLAPLTIEQLVEGVTRKLPFLDTGEAREGLATLAGQCGGSMRQLWQITQKWESYDLEMTPDLASTMTGGATSGDRARLWAAVDAGDFKGIAGAWKRMLEGGADPNRVGGQLAEDMYAMAATDPTGRDWCRHFAAMSQAQLLKDQGTFLTVLMSMARSTTRPAAAVPASELADAIADRLRTLPDSRDVLLEFAGMLNEFGQPREAPKQPAPTPASLPFELGDSKSVYDFLTSRLGR